MEHLASFFECQRSLISESILAGNIVNLLFGRGPKSDSLGEVNLIWVQLGRLQAESIFFLYGFEVLSYKVFELLLRNFQELGDETNR